MLFLSRQREVLLSPQIIFFFFFCPLSLFPSLSRFSRLSLSLLFSALLSLLLTLRLYNVAVKAVASSGTLGDGFRSRPYCRMVSLSTCDTLAFGKVGIDISSPLLHMADMLLLLFLLVNNNRYDLSLALLLGNTLSVMVSVNPSQFVPIRLTTCCLLLVFTTLVVHSTTTSMSCPIDCDGKQSVEAEARLLMSAHHRKLPTSCKIALTTVK